jgi:hypothetical protein
MQAFRYRRISVRLRPYVNTNTRSLTDSDGFNELAVREYERLLLLLLLLLLLFSRLYDVSTSSCAH